MKIKRIKKLTTMCGDFTVRWDKSSFGGYVSFSDHEIMIGTAPCDTEQWDTIVHECSELAHVGLSQRFGRPDCSTGDFLFSFNHAGHASHSTALAAMLSQFIG